MVVKRIVIVRHGETDYNVQHRWQGHLDVPLNAIGQQQAEAAAKHLKTTPIDRIIASDLKRAYDTALAIAKVKQLKVQKDTRLREVHLGDFQGLTRSQIQDLYPQEYMRWDHDDNFAVPNGESRIQLQNRAYQAWQSATALVDVKTVLLVSHGGTIRMLLAKLFPDRAGYVKLKNTSISILDRDEIGHWQPTVLNTMPHWE